MSAAIAKLMLRMMPLASVLGFGTSLYLIKEQLYCKDDLDSDFAQLSTRSAVELAEFQEDAVRKARRILAQYDGVIVADSVGLGKTWIGKKLLEDYAYHLRQK